MAISKKTTDRHNRWKRQILDIIRHANNPSRILIKRQTGLSMESTLRLINELLEEGLINSKGFVEASGAGRKATLLKINSDACYFIGVRFNAGGISGVCMDFERNIICESQKDFPNPPDAKTMIEMIVNSIELLLLQLGECKTKLRGIGIGAPGIIDLESGIIKRYAHIQNMKNTPLRDIIQHRFSVPTFLEHGVKCTARAILSMPEHLDTNDLLFLQMGRGINMCLIIGRRIVNGTDYLAGEIGHMHVSGNANLCDCGRIGCLETVIGSDGLCKAAKSGIEREPQRYTTLSSLINKTKQIHLALLCQATELGCQGCLELLEKAGRVIGEALSAFIMLTNPQKVILSGRLSSSNAFCKAVEQALQTFCLPESLESAKICFMQVNSQLDSIGAAELPHQKIFGVQET